MIFSRGKALRPTRRLLRTSKGDFEALISVGNIMCSNITSKTLDLTHLDFLCQLLFSRERREAELCEAYRNAATPEEAALVLQRYALRFTISDATLDSLKLPRSTSNPTQDLNHIDKEHKTTSSANDPETSEPLHKQKPTVIAGQTSTEPEEKKTDTTTQQQKPLSVSSKPPTPDSPLSPVTNSENVPPRSLQLDDLQSKTTEAPTKQQKQLITGDAKPQTKPTQPPVAQVQPETAQPIQTLRSPPSVSRPVPLLAAKPYCQPRNTQSGHKPFKVSTHVSKTSHMNA